MHPFQNTFSKHRTSPSDWRAAARVLVQGGHDGCTYLIHTGSSACFTRRVSSHVRSICEALRKRRANVISGSLLISSVGCFAGSDEDSGTTSAEREMDVTSSEEAVAGEDNQKQDPDPVVGRPFAFSPAVLEAAGIRCKLELFVVPSWHRSMGELRAVETEVPCGKEKGGGGGADVQLTDRPRFEAQWTGGLSWVAVPNSSEPRTMWEDQSFVSLMLRHAFQNALTSTACGNAARRRSCRRWWRGTS